MLCILNFRLIDKRGTQLHIIPLIEALNNFFGKYSIEIVPDKIDVTAVVTLGGIPPLNTVEQLSDTLNLDGVDMWSENTAGMVIGSKRNFDAFHFYMPDGGTLIRKGARHERIK